MILASSAPSPPTYHHRHADDDDDDEEEDEAAVGHALPHAQLLRCLLQAVPGGPGARAALVDSRNRNGKTGEHARMRACIRCRRRPISPVVHTFDC